MERNALRKFYGIRSSKIGINGKCVQMSAIARNLSTDLMRISQTSRVVIVFDRETRSESSIELSGELSAILKADFPKMKFFIGVPDRDMEAWLFADKEMISKHFKKRIGKKARFEGEVGAESIKKHIGPGRYNKMVDGLALISKLDWKKVREFSPSAAQFGLNDAVPRLRTH